MVIYGVALLAGCFLLGKVLGSLLGALLGVHANVGGVGISMLVLVILADVLIRKGKISPKTRDGILFWNAMYIPIVVAMAAKQNVYAAIKGGPLAIIAGVITTLICFALVPVISKIGQKSDVIETKKGTGSC